MARDQHRSTDRALDILEYLASAKGVGHTLTELAAALDAPKSSLFPIIHTLLNRKYIQLDRPSGRYYIGISSYVLGAAFSNSQNVLDHILNVMESVVESCEETCQLGVLDRERVLYIRKVDSPQPIRMISHVGNRLPANATAIGKALLSGLTDQEIRELYADGLPRLTNHTIVDLDVLLAQLAEVRKSGIAWEQEESADLIRCLAVPLCKEGNMFAAISVAVPLFRFSEAKESLVLNSLFKAKKEIEMLTETKNFVLELI